MSTVQDSIVQTKLGTIEGRERDGVHRFLGIRYAQAPVGDLRFRAPVPVEPWDGALEARSFGTSAPQPAQQPGNPLPGRDVAIDEDCLFLNVLTPAPDGGKRPVFVWIHGGSYTAGSGNPYDGTSFCQLGDIVVVTINYRLGVLGFMELGHLDPSLAGSQNNGIRDQIAALEWVNAHIDQFGGDPDQVTICGESAGGGSIVSLLAAPAADHLYHRAIAQSPPVSFAPINTQYADEIVDHIGGFDALRSASVDEILATQAGVAAAGASGRNAILIGDGRPGLRPMIDKHTITRHPAEAVTELGAAAKPLMIGTNADEGTLFAMYLPNDITEDEFRAAVAVYNDDPDDVIAAFRETYADESPRGLMRRMLTDTMFRSGALALADAQTAAGGEVFTYFFTWASEGFDGRLGSMHALEIPFVWNGELAPWAPIMGENEPWPDDLSDRMHRAWIGFVRDGNPSHESIGEWPAHDLELRPTMEFGDTSEVIHDPLGRTRASWG